MKTKPFVFPLLTLIACITLSRVALTQIALTQNAAQKTAQNAVLTVDTDKTGPRLSPFQHGIFFEEINHAGDGGLYPEKLRDRDFRDGTTYWTAFGGASVEKNGDVLEIKAGNTEGGVRTEGYWGIACEKGKALKLSVEVSRPVIARLVTLKGVVLAKTELKKGGAVMLTPTQTYAKSVLEFVVPAGTSVTLHQPSLMPMETFGKSKVRKDLGELVAGMKPSFVRFPGGCFVEGDILANRFNWKNSLGPVASRPGNQCLWGYHATNGMGYHEYLQWCEDSGAAPLFVISAGMSHNGVVPMAQMDGILQEALDALEYANGDAKTTKWGAMRAKNGHSTPFNLKLIEIGNENGGPQYDERYKMLYEGIKKAYPETITIANLWGGLPKSAPIETIDEHYYSNPAFFIQNATRYDTYDRKGPKIYVGEYAVTEGCGKGNLIAGVAEAAFITGMERNSDVVKMASYAPLFVNDNNRAWNPDAIVFDSSRAYGTPSYWVQRLFSENRGTVVLPQTLTAPPPRATPEVYQGGVGVATWGTDAEFADVAIEGKPVTLKPGKGKWAKTAEGTLRQSDADGENLAAMGGDPKARNYTLTLRAKKHGGREGFLIPFYVRSENDFLWWNLGGWGNTQHQIEYEIGGSKSALIQPPVKGKIETGRWYDIKIECQGPHIRCYLDGKLIHDVMIPAPPTSLHSVVTREEREERSEKSGDILLKIVNAGPDAQPTQIKLLGQVKLTGTGIVTTLTSNDPMEENSFENPKRIAPVTKPLTKISTDFMYNAAPYSVNILRLKTQK